MSYLRWRTFQVLRNFSDRENIDAHPDGSNASVGYPDIPVYLDCVVYDNNAVPITDGSVDWVIDWTPVTIGSSGLAPDYGIINGALTFSLDSSGWDNSGAPYIARDSYSVDQGILTIRAKGQDGIFFDGVLEISLSNQEGYWNEYVDAYSDIAWLTGGEEPEPLFWTKFVKSEERQS